MYATEAKESRSGIYGCNNMTRNSLFVVCFELVCSFVCLFI